MSAFSWIDHSEKQRRQILEAIDLFREKDTRDELGIAVIRDAFADLLFPGTGSLQRRARYFFFVPWMYRRFEEKGVGASAIAWTVREFEIRLIDTLAGSPDPRGTIGIDARSSLQRTPSSIYWNGLKVLGICRFNGSQAEYQRSFDRIGANRRGVLRNDDGEVVSGGTRTTWSAIPAAPPEFPDRAAFRLTQAEAEYFRERVLEHDPGSLFAYLLQRPHKPFDEGFVWDHDVNAGVNGRLSRQIEHARNFSEVIFGAPILYNLILSDLEPVRKDVREMCLGMLEEWRVMMAERREAHLRWDRRDFWNLVRECGAVPRQPTHWFVDAWADLALAADLRQLSENRAARDLIASRERNIKGPLARCDNRRARELWRGESGLNRLDYRWTNAQVILSDVFVGLGEIDA
jgi:hypothetical protein